MLYKRHTRTRRKKSKQSVEQKPWIAIMLGVATSLVTLLLSVFLFALIFKVAALEDGVISPVNQVLRVIAIGIGSIYCVTHSAGRGFWKGAACGTITMFLGHMIYVVIAGAAAGFGVWLSDMLLGLLAGGVSGMIFTPREETAKAS